MSEVTRLTNEELRTISDAAWRALELKCGTKQGADLPTVKHIRTGELYSVYGVTLNEATTEPLVTYFGHVGGIFWSRPLNEFLARFERCG